MIRFLRRSKPQLLVLDDDTSMQKLVAALLRREGYGVDVVSSGSQAIEKIGKREYGALLLDVMTPTDGGFTVIKHLKQSNPSLLGRVVLLTASPETVLRSVAPDIFGVVHKPFEAAQLIETIARVIAQ
jgi:two-component system response regulator AtoC